MSNFAECYTFVCPFLCATVPMVSWEGVLRVLKFHRDSLSSPTLPKGGKIVFRRNLQLLLWPARIVHKSPETAAQEPSKRTAPRTKHELLGGVQLHLKVPYSHLNGLRSQLI